MNNELKITNIIIPPPTIVSIVDEVYNIDITSPYPVDISIMDIGIQGMRGAQGQRGNSLLFDWNNTSLGIKKEDDISYTYTELRGGKLLYSDLTQNDKTDLLQDVGNTTTNYVNIFYTSLT